MALEIEDGNIISGANSFVTLQEIRDYASARGLTANADDTILEAQTINAMDYIRSIEDKFQSIRTDPQNQELPFPRQVVEANGRVFAANEIPQILKDGQSQLTIDAAIQNLQPTGSGREVIRTKVDVIETQFAEKGTSSVKPVLNKSLDILEPLFRPNVGKLTTLRI